MNAYQPRLSTVQLLADIKRLPRVTGARIVAPTHGTHPAPARIRVESNRTRYLSLAEARVLTIPQTVTTVGGREIVIAPTGDFDALGNPVYAEVSK
jgi:hypothetical protein